MTHTLFIKNMVCDRCKTVVQKLLDDHGLKVVAMELGKVVIQEMDETKELKLEKALSENGFELIIESSEALIEQIKIMLIKLLENSASDNLLMQLPTKLGKTYATLSKTFSKSEGITLEKYLINLKIEKVKESIQLQQLNFSEIAYSLNYNNSSHLARQFKNVTGMSMTVFKNLQKWNRKPIDQIV